MKRTREISLDTHPRWWVNTDGGGEGVSIGCSHTGRIMNGCAAELQYWLDSSTEPGVPSYFKS